MSKNSAKPIKPPAQTKANKILKLLQPNTGATIAEIAKATDWQRHSLQGFMLATLKKKLELEIKSMKLVYRDRRYRIEGHAQ
jgi:predicted transcriptional regulator